MLVNYYLPNIYNSKQYTQSLQCLFKLYIKRLFFILSICSWWYASYVFSFRLKNSFNTSNHISFSHSALCAVLSAFNINSSLCDTNSSKVREPKTKVTIEDCLHGKIKPSYVKAFTRHDRLCFVMMELVFELMIDFMLEINNLNTFREDLFNFYRCRHPMVDDCSLF